MDLQEYQRVYVDLQLAVIQIGTISVCAGDALSNFPHRLPEQSRETAYAALREMQQKIGKIIQAHESGSMDFSDTELDDEILDQRASAMIVDLYMTTLIAGRNGREFDFERLLYAQEMIMVLAHLDAFLADTLRAICTREPRLLMRGNKISWREVLEAGSWDRILTRLIDEYSYEFGWKSARERIAYLRDEHGLVVDISDAILDKLDLAEELRHLFVHNGGRVSRKYLERSGRTGIDVGSIITLSAQDASSIGIIVRRVGSAVFASAATKFFGASLDDLSGLWPSSPATSEDG